MKQFLFLFLFLVSAGFMSAQRTITGTVTDEAGVSLIGANVLVKEAPTVGTITDIDGSFSLQIPSGGTTLVISYAGYSTKEIPLTADASYTVTLAEGQLLEEVVVTSFGTTTRERFTGSAASISAEKIGVRPVTNVGQVLTGIAAGVQSTFGSGQPGSAPAIRIRGFGSISSSQDPLYVIDGVPTSVNIANLNADDIENVTVLKDASSTALYGSRAANGVVLITTKKGKKGKNSINVKYTRGQSGRAVPEYDRIGAADYYPIMWESYRNSLAYRAANPIPIATANTNASRDIAGLLAYNVYNVPGAELVSTEGKLNPNAQLLYSEDDLDWEKPLIRNGGRDEVTLNMSGGTEDSDYYFSLGRLEDKGFLIRTSYERYTGRLTFNSKLKSWVKVGANLGYTYSLSEDNDAGGNTNFVNPFFFSRGMGPIYPVYAFDPAKPGTFLLDSNGNKRWDYGNLNALGLPNRPQYGGRHAIAETLMNTNDFRRNVFTGRTYADFSFLKDFKLTLNAGLDYTNRYDNTFQNPEIGDGAPAGRATTRYFNGTSLNLGQILNYKKQINRHTFDVLLGHESFHLQNNELTGSRSQLIAAGNTDLVNFTTTTDLSSITDNRSIEGYFSRLNYDLDEKYFISLSARADGTSRFAPDKRWGTFYSVGAAWRIDQEDFMKNISWVNNLKLRGSFGQTGNEDIGTFYAWQNLYILGSGVNNAAEAGLIQDRAPGNPNLQWETNNAFDVALEFGVFDKKITGTVEYFHKESSDLLFDVPLPFSTGLTSQFANIGTMLNKGIELELNVTPVRTKDFEWTVSANVTAMNNQITKMPETSPTIVSGTKRLEVGRSIQNYYLREFMGVNPATGESEYRAITLNPANSRITAAGDTVTNNINNARFRTMDAEAIPDFYGGFSNSLTYKGLTLSALFVYQLGGKVYDGAYAGLMGTGGYGSSKHPDILNRWQKEGDITNVPRMDNGRTADFNGASDRWLIDGSALSLRSVTLAYNLPKSLLQKVKLANAQFVLSGENLAIWSKRKGMNAFDAFSGVTSNTYSFARTWAGGISLTF